MIKKIRIVTALSALGLIVGCSPSDSERSSVSSTTDNSVTFKTPTRDSNVTFSATSRDTNAPSRIYSPDTTSASTPNELKAPDNTGKNVRDRNDNTLTPGDQGTSDSDRDITRQIRRALTSDDSLSTTAKNIKIITVNGKVTLRGPVKSEQEQKAIADAAQKVAGQASIDNQLEVKTTNQ